MNTLCSGVNRRIRVQAELSSLLVQQCYSDAHVRVSGLPAISLFDVFYQEKECDFSLTPI